MSSFRACNANGGRTAANETASSDVVEEAVPGTDEETVYVAHHDVTEDGLTVTMTLALSEVVDASPTELIPEFPRYVDPDALDRMFRPGPDGELKEGGPLFLTVRGVDVRIFNTGRIEIRP